jgi:hypothetical protein
MFDPGMRPKEDFDAVVSMLRSGLSGYEIARRTGVPPATVHRWLTRPYRVRKAAAAAPPDDWRPPDAWAYAYLLGLYLGDGCIFVGKGHWASLRLYLDARYELIIAAARDALRRTTPTARITIGSKPGCAVVTANDPIWVVAFPQHGPGRKHTRPIRLTSWQREVTRRYPKALLRGLIHSDGCRTVNRFTVRLPKSGDHRYEYSRYFFTNASVDIQRIFSSHCELLGVRWTQSKPRMISVSDRASVAILDSFIGPKA